MPDIIYTNINDSGATTLIAPLHPQAIALPLLAFPSWILCIPPLFWHFRQGNIAAGSLILWCVMINFFNAINPLIWPRDNISEWWNGNVWCDINVRIQVGAVVGTTASAAMIVRKLAKVMDTSSITVSTSRNQKIKENVLEIFWCWGYPLIMILLYYIVQPARYMIYGIVGCISIFDATWPSIVLSFMWAPITTVVAGIYACILSYRLYRYRREFVRLVAARNTTKSRFIRLFIICLIIVAVYIPYTTWLLVVLWRASTNATDTYSWSRIHDPTRFNTIVKVPANGQVTIDKWGQVVTGYVLFFVFGTGSDAENTYKSALLAIGLGRFFPCLYARRESGASTPRSFIVARSWGSTLSSRAKSMWWSKTDSVAQTTTRGDSVSMSRLRPVSTEERVLDHDTTPPPRSSFCARLFARRAHSRSTVLPLFAPRSVTEMTDTNTHKSSTRDVEPGVSAHAWATDKASSRRGSEADGVHVVREVHLDCRDRNGTVNERKSADAWA